MYTNIFYGVYVCAQSLRHVQLFATPWTEEACQVLLSMEYFQQDYWSGLPFPTPEDLPNAGIEIVSLPSPALSDGLFTIHKKKYNFL